MAKRYPIGINGIDQVLCDGIPVGQLVIIESDADTPVEALLRHLTLQQPTVFVTTERFKADVEEWLDRRQQLTWEDPTSALNSSDQLVTTGTSPSIQIVDACLEDALATATERLDQLTESVNIMVDSINALEEGSERAYLEFLRQVKQYARDTDQIVYLHVLNNADSDDTPSNRTLTYKTADIIWEFVTNITDGEMSHQLTITKDRTGLCPNEPFTLQIDNESDITADTGRNITL